MKFVVADGESYVRSRMAGQPARDVNNDRGVMHDVDAERAVVGRSRMMRTRFPRPMDKKVSVSLAGVALAPGPRFQKPRFHSYVKTWPTAARKNVKVANNRISGVNNARLSVLGKK